VILLPTLSSPQVFLSFSRVFVRTIAEFSLKDATQSKLQSQQVGKQTKGRKGKGGTKITNFAS